MTDRPGDCWTCGHPSLRPKGHAEWCERVAAAVMAENGGVCRGCGKDFGTVQALGGHWSRRPCLTSALSTAVEPSPATELAAVDNAEVGPSDHATPTARMTRGVPAPSTSAGVPNGTAGPAAPQTNKAPGVSAPRASNSAASHAAEGA